MFKSGCRGGLQAAWERCPARDLPGWPPAPRAAYTRPLRPDGKGMSGHSRQDVGAACRPPGSVALPGIFRVGRPRPGPRTRGPYGPTEKGCPAIPGRMQGRPAGRPGALPCPGPSGLAARAPGRVHAAPTSSRKHRNTSDSQPHFLSFISYSFLRACRFQCVAQRRLRYVFCSVHKAWNFHLSIKKHAFSKTCSFQNLYDSIIRRALHFCKQSGGMFRIFSK